MLPSFFFLLLYTFRDVGRHNAAAVFANVCIMNIMFLNTNTHRLLSL